MPGQLPGRLLPMLGPHQLVDGRQRLPGRKQPLRRPAPQVTGLARKLALQLPAQERAEHSMITKYPRLTGDADQQIRPQQCIDA
ncbi:hypothetical protein D3C80_641690 [compost metagenome]